MDRQAERQLQRFNLPVMFKLPGLTRLPRCCPSELPTDIVISRRAAMPWHHASKELSEGLVSSFLLYGVGLSCWWLVPPVEAGRRQQANIIIVFSFWSTCTLTSICLRGRQTKPPCISWCAKPVSPSSSEKGIGRKSPKKGIGEKNKKNIKHQAYLYKR